MTKLFHGFAEGYGLYAKVVRDSTQLTGIRLLTDKQVKDLDWVAVHWDRNLRLSLRTELYLGFRKLKRTDLFCHNCYSSKLKFIAGEGFQKKGFRCQSCGCEGIISTLLTLSEVERELRAFEKSAPILDPILEEDE